MGYTVASEISALVLGILVGAAVMGGGVLLAAALQRRGFTPTEVSPEELVRLLRRLSEWTNGIAHEVAQFDSAVEQWSPSFATADANPDGNDAAEKHPNSSDLLLNANRRLKEKLAVARKELERQSQLIQQLIERARSDPLTGLPNRRAFQEQFQQSLSGWKRHGRPFSVIFADLDGFKALNDRFGHAAGDAALTHVANILRSSLREVDLLARYGGEEFVVLLPDTPIREACLVAERMRLAVASRPVSTDKSRLTVTLSCGVACIQMGEDAKSLLRRADESLYAAKRNGKNRTFWHDGTTARPVNQLRASTAIEQQVAKNVASVTEEEWLKICAELRDRLRTVLHSNPASSPQTTAQ